MDATTLTDTTPFSDDERRERDRLVCEAHSCQTDIGRNEADFGRHLNSLNERKLYRENGKSWPTFVEEEFSLCSTSAYNLIAMASVCDDLIGADCAPLTVKSHALFVAPLEPAELRIAAVEHARKVAADSGCRLTAALIKQACEAVTPAQTEETRTGISAPSSARNDADRAAVRAYNGLTVVAAGDGVDESRTLATLPGGKVVPYAEDLEWKTGGAREADAVAFVLTPLDDVTENTWPVVAPDPWEAATSWSAVGNSPVFFPERLTAPQARTKREMSDRERTVLVAPGVDLLSPVVPDRIIKDIFSAVAADACHRYLVLTDYPDRVPAADLPSNVFVCAEAVGTAEHVEVAASALADVKPNALVVRDLAEPVDAGVLDGIDWILVRGSKTSQEAYDSIRAALGPSQALDLGRDVKARHSGYPALPARDAASTS